MGTFSFLQPLTRHCVGHLSSIGVTKKVIQKIICELVPTIMAGGCRMFGREAISCVLRKILYLCDRTQCTYLSTQEPEVEGSPSA